MTAKNLTHDEFIERLLSRAKAAGFEAADAFLMESSAFEVAVNRGELIRYDVSDSLELGFRGLLRGKMGGATTQALDEDAIDMLVDSAKMSAELCESEDEEFIFEGSPSYPEISDEHPEIANLSAAQKIEMARELEQRTLDADPSVDSVGDCLLYSGHSSVRLVNSRGLELRRSRDTLGAYVSAVARRGERTGLAGRQAFARDPSRLDLGRMAKEAAGEAAAFLEADSLPSGRYSVLFRPEMAATLLSTFVSLFSAEAAQKGLSLLAGKEGTNVAARCVNLVDDPLDPRCYLPRAFDEEGVAARRTSVIENGELRTLLHNLKTARKQGVATTGNAERATTAGPMGVAPVNLCIRPGELPPEALYERAGDAILVTDMMGMHSGANAVSGDFSLGAKGFLIRNGQIERPVEQITIAGNFLELLRDIEAAGSDLRFTPRRCASPTLLVHALSVAGK